MPTSTPRSPRCRRRSCAWLEPRSTPANRGSPYVSLLEAHRQADSECLGELTLGLIPKAEGALEHIVYEVILVRSHFHSLSLSLLCSSSRSGYSPHCLINLHLDLVKVSLLFSVSQLLSNKSTSHWWKKKDAVDWAFLMHFFLINYLYIYFFFVDI